MSLGRASGDSSRQSSIYNAKRLYLGLGGAGLLFVVWLLSTPIHQIYWATQDSFSDAKNAAFASRDQSDGQYRTAAESFDKQTGQPLQKADPEASSQSISLPRLLKHIQVKVAGKFGRANHQHLPSTEDSRELLDQPHQQTLSAQDQPAVTTANHETNITNHSQQQSTPHSGRHSHDSAQLDLVTHAESSPAPNSDLQGVIREAQDLGLEASVMPYNHTATPSTTTNTSILNATEPHTLRLGSKSNLSGPAEVLIRAAGQSSLGVGPHTAHGRQNVSQQPLSSSDAAELEFGLEELDRASMQSDAIDDMTLYTGESINDNDDLLLPGQALPDTEVLGGEADPARGYTVEESVVEAAEPMSNAIHREEEAHRAVAALGAKATHAAAHKLTKSLVQSVASDNMVMVTWANFHYLDFTMNWVRHVQAVNISSYLVGAMDDELLEALVERGVNCFAMQSGLSTADFGWGSKQFHKMGREKIGLVLTFTDMGFDIVVSDVDTVWLKNPVPYLAQYPEADILVSSDSLHATTTDGALEMFPAAGVANIGIMLFRSTAMQFAEEWNEALLANDDYWDQNAFNDLMNKGAKFDDQRSDRLFMGFHGRLKMGILPVSTFCSGHTFFIQRMADTLGLEPYVVHATFQFSGTPGKRHRMRESQLWVMDPEEYYRPPGGLLTFDLHLHDLVQHSAPNQQLMHSVDSGLQRNNLKLDDNKAGHFELANAQIQQVRAAMAVATALNRTLVMPQLWCGMDRWWAPHDGNIPGSSLQLPFKCPMDHIFDLEQMIQHRPEDALGPHIDWREHSLLNNTQMPPEDIASTAHIHICQEDEAGCSAGSTPAVVGGSSTVVGLQANLTDQQLRIALSGLKDTAIVHFDTMQGAFGGHASHGDASRFQRRTEIHTSLWCCVDAHPGHVWYDMWWDQIPHEDRHKRQISTAWKPSTGP